MKRIYFVLFSVVFLTCLSQDDKTWRLGIQLGAHGNQSKLSGGSPNANARFNHNEFSGGSIELIGRYDVNKHWMLMSGLGFHSFGFGYSISENYSLLNKDRSYTGINSEFGAVGTSAMVFYKFNPNCKNAKWLVGAGLAQDFIAANKINRNVSQAIDGNTSVNYISSTSTTKGGVYWNFRWSVGREKVFKNNSILNASVLFNFGFNQVATSTVDYTIDNQTYSHTFTNNGNFIGLRLTYYFKPFVNPWDNKKKHAVKSTTK